jgi:D-arabinose 1-dehydrogenase-like Zn-dependent alcohol dehydrogenase
MIAGTVSLVTPAVDSYRRGGRVGAGVMVTGG